MDKIASFTIDHEKLMCGVYVSRIDKVGSESVTTFDIRMRKPNREPVMDVPTMHTIEHLGATFLRNHTVWKEEILYFGPMGCRTGFYLLVKGERNSSNIMELLSTMFGFIADFTGDIPGATAVQCGNYLDQNLPMARYEAKRFLEETLTNIREENMYYPE